MTYTPFSADMPFYVARELSRRAGTATPYETHAVSRCGTKFQLRGVPLAIGPEEVAHLVANFHDLGPHALDQTPTDSPDNYQGVLRIGRARTPCTTVSVKRHGIEGNISVDVSRVGPRAK